MIKTATRTGLLALVFAIGCAPDLRENMPSNPDLSAFPDSLAERIESAESRIREAPNRRSAWLELGQLYHVNGFHDEARQAYDTLLGLDSEGRLAPQATYYLADIARERGEIEEAIAFFGKTIELDPTYLPSYLDLGELLFKSGKPDAAKNAYLSLIARDRSNSYALLGLARIHSQKGNDQDALELLDTIEKTNPRFTSSKGLMAQILDRSGDANRAKAIRRLNTDSADLPEKNRWMEQALENCYDTQKLSFLFEDLKNGGEIEKAFEYLERIERIDPSNWNAQLARGLFYADNGRIPEAIERYRNAIELGGAPGTIYTLLTKALVQTKQFAEAKSTAIEGLRKAPYSADIMIELAGVHALNGDMDSATALFENALEIDPYNMRALQSLARISFIGGNDAAAMERLDRMRQIDPNDPQPELMIGKRLLNQGRMDEAIEQLDKAAKLEITDRSALASLAQAYLAIGDTAFEENDYEKAISIYRKSALAVPEIAEPRMRLTKTFMRIGDFPKAEEAMSGLLSTHPNDPSMHIAMGDIQSAMGRLAAARASWEHALRIIGNEEASELRAAISARIGKQSQAN